LGTIECYLRGCLFVDGDHEIAAGCRAPLQVFEVYSCPIQRKLLVLFKKFFIFSQ
jgi:hypothetical protein